MRKQKIMLFVFVLATFSCIAPFGLLFGTPIIREWTAKQNFRIIEGAEYLFEDLGLYGGSSSQRSVYYWIDRPVEEVKSYYQVFTAPFIVAEDDYGTWQIALLQPESTVLETPIKKYAVHGSLCNYQERYDCITVAIIDTSQPDLYRLGISSPSMFRHDGISSEFASLPDYGTLIVYSYYVYDW